VRRLGLAVVFAAIAVLAPRLVVLFLVADGGEVPPSWRSALLATSSVAMAVVLTGGAAYLAHAVARRRRFRGLLLTCWLILLTSIALLLTPLLAGALHGAELAAVLSDPRLRWLWSAVAALAPELVAGGAMVALAGAELDREQEDDLAGELEEVARERNRAELELHQLRAQLASSSRRPEPQGAPVPCRNGCGRVFANRRAENGHQRACTIDRTEVQ
jgi:MFS family permease